MLQKTLPIIMNRKFIDISMTIVMKASMKKRFYPIMNTWNVNASVLTVLNGQSVSVPSPSRSNAKKGLNVRKPKYQII